jgi:putative phosphoesterase
LRIAALYDIHGNLHALDAVLAELEAEGIHRIVCGGDLLSPPSAVECLERLRDVDAEVDFVQGNADLLDIPSLAATAEGWPLTVELGVEGLGRVVFCHGSPRDNEEILTRISPEERVAEALAGVEADVVVGGHTHVQFDRTVAGRRLVNAGSVGLPYEGRPGAFWALLGPEVELRRTEYDVEPAAAAYEAAGKPDYAGWLRDPPGADETTAFFESRVGA